MNEMLETKLDTPFSTGYTGYIGYKPPEASTDKGLSGVASVTKTDLAIGSLGYNAPKTDEKAPDTLISPIPDDAPPIPKRFGHLIVDGEKAALSAQWDYRNAQGQPLFYIRRFDFGPGDKQFRPLTLWRTPTGLEWRKKAPHEPRPLYGLDRLAARPEAEVILCEGEKAADAAGRLFPEKVAITSLNGAKSPDKSDWTALAGRTVTLWPDNDAPGASYIAEVEPLATTAGARVTHTLQPSADLPQGWDAADSERDGLTAESIAALLVPLDKAPPDAVTLAKDAETKKKRAQTQELFADSEFAVIEGRKGFKNGVYWQERCAEGDEPKAPIRLCSPLIVVAETRDDAQSEWGRLLVWEDNDKHEHQWACPVELLAASDTGDFRRSIMRNGLPFVSSNGKARQKLVDYVLGFKPQSPDRVRCVTKTGWYGNRYVLSHRVFGKNAGEGVIYQGAAISDFASAGTLADWQREVSARAVGNSRMLFAIACSFAGPLVDMANESGGGFQFTGETSKGKTSTLIDPAASVWGHPERFAKKWRTTANGLEGLCLSRNDSTLILDDLGQANARESGQAAYLIANGQGKARMLKEGGNRPLSTWKTLLLSSGEIDLAQFMAEAGNVPRGGQVARLPSIPADAGAGHYVLENLHDQPDGRQFADTMKAVSRQCYGTAGEAFIEKLTDPAILKEIQESIREGITEIVKLMRVPEGAAPEVGRVAARFALVAFAGELATRLGVTGWPQGAAFKAVIRCFNDWLTDAGGGLGADEKALFAQVSSFLQSHGASRFPPHDITEEDLRRVLNRAGFSFNDNGNIYYWAESGTFTKELCKGFNAKAAAKTLAKAKWLEPGQKRNQQQQRIPALGKTGVWLYVLTPLAVGVEE